MQSTATCHCALPAPTLQPRQYYFEWLGSQMHKARVSVPVDSATRRLSSVRRVAPLRLLADLLPSNLKRAMKSLMSPPPLPAVTNLQREFAFSYLEYILKADPQFDLPLFPDEDHSTIRSFLDNIFTVCHYDSFPLEQSLGSAAYRSAMQRHSTFNRAISRQGDTYTCCGFSSPKRAFEYNVFVEQCGISYIPEARRASLEGLSFVDCGAFIGDSSFVLNVLKPREILALEPNPENFACLVGNVKRNGMDNVIPLGIAAGDTFCSSSLSDRSHSISQLSAAPGDITVTTIDTLAQSRPAPIGLIKMDIEGAELPALKGAAGVISSQKPVLLVAVYHSGTDFFEIPIFLKSLRPDYEFRFAALNLLTPTFERMLIAY